MAYDIAPPRVRSYLDAEIEFLMDRIEPGDRVLELGCGAKQGWKVLNLDPRTSGAMAMKRVTGYRNTLYPMFKALPSFLAISLPMGRFPFSISEIFRNAGRQGEEKDDRFIAR